MVGKVPRNPAVKVAEKQRYSWPPPVAPEDVYVPKEKNPIHSILTALPVIMLVAGLYFYYQNESEQTLGTPIQSESMNIEGVFTGMSVVKTGSQGRHYLWINVNGSTRGVRIRPDQVSLVEDLQRDVETQLSIAPTVPESKTYWAWRVSQAGTVFVNMNLVPE